MAPVISHDLSVAADTGHLDALIDHQDAARQLDTDPTARNHPDFGGRLDDINTRIRHAITGADPTPDRDAAASAALGAVWRPLRRYDPDQLRHVADAILDVALTGHDDTQ